MSNEAGRGGGLLGSLRQLVSTVVEIAGTRIELFVTEFDEERGRIARTLWLAAISAFCLALAMLLAVAFIIALFWDTHRLLAIGSLAAVFGVAGIATLAALRAAAAEHKRMFSQTLAELRTDRERLSQ
jgi:uncharacterized membrane protein YqjE